MSIVATHLRKAAEELAEFHRQAEESIVRIYLFPDPEGKEIRLIDIDNTAAPSGDAIVPTNFAPQSFGPDKSWRLASSIAIIPPAEERMATLPAAWKTDWEQAEPIWERGAHL